MHCLAWEAHSCAGVGAKHLAWKSVLGNRGSPISWLGALQFVSDCKQRGGPNAREYIPDAVKFAASRRAKSLGIAQPRN